MPPMTAPQAMKNRAPDAGRSDGRDNSVASGDPVIVLAPLGRDAAIVCRVLGAAGIACAAAAGIADFTAAIRAADAAGTAGAAVLTEEALTPAGVVELA